MAEKVVRFHVTFTGDDVDAVMKTLGKRFKVPPPQRRSRVRLMGGPGEQLILPSD